MVREFNTWYGRTTSQQHQRNAGAKVRIVAVQAMQFNWISKGCGVQTAAINGKKKLHIIHI